MSPTATRAARIATITLVATSTVVATSAAPAWAHAVGGRADLPLPLWMFAYGAAGVLVVSFAALAVFWPTARLEGTAGAPVPTTQGPSRGPLTYALWVARAFGVVSLGVVVGAALFGPPEGRPNLSIPAVYVTFWVGFMLLSALVGDVWRAINPFPVLAGGVGVVATRIRATNRPVRPYRLGHWPAAALLFAFVWLELVYPYRGNPRHLGIVLVAYTVIAVAGARRWGRPWLRQGEAFSAFFGILAHMAPLYVQDRRIRARLPLVGLAGMKPRAGTEALIVTALGSTSFDGLGRTRIWLDATADLDVWPLAIVSTVGMVGMIAVVYVAYQSAVRVSGSGLTAVAGDESPSAERLASAFVHSLVPIVFGYALAHYFSYFVLEGQATYTLMSDPFGKGWDLFGTATRAIDYGLVSPGLVSWVQVGGIVVGHVAGVVLAHDRALALIGPPDATKSQYPLLAAMVLFTVGGLFLLFSS